MSSDNINTEQQSRWKQRYYEALDELEQKEKNWREAERLIRHLISRLALAADSRHKALNQELIELRNSVRDGHDFLKLRDHIDLITDQVAELDKMRKRENRRGHPATLFVDVLAKLDLSDEATREFRKFRKLVKQLDRDAPSDAVNDEVVGLLKGFLQPATDSDARPSRKQRLLDRILSRQKSAENEGEVTDAESGADETTGSDEADAQEQINKEIRKRTDPNAKFVAPAVGDLLLQLFMRMPEAVKRRINFPALKKHTNRARTRRDLIPIVEVIAQQIEAAYTLDVPANIEIANDSIQAIAQPLQQIFEELEPPQDLKVRMAELEKYFSENHEQVGDLVHCLNSLADIVHEICQRLIFQRDELESYFVVLGNQLGDMDAGLQETSALNEAARQSTQKMDQAVHAEIQAITDGMANEIEIEQLKILIRQRLDAIDQHLQVFQDDESSRLQQADVVIAELSEKIEGLEVENDKLRTRLDEPRKQSLRDILTGIPNRQAYEERIATEIARCRRYSSSLCLIVWDVDKFKSINQDYGHAAGDKVLKAVAEMLDRQVRATDFLARFGGEEFVLLLPEIELESAKQVANKLRQVIENTPFHFRNNRVPVTVSGGLAQLNRDEPANDFFERADKALSEAKENGRNRIEIAKE